MIKYLNRTGGGRLRGTALLRLDFNTEDDWRMRAAVPTIKFLLRRASGIVIASHRGRPAPLVSARSGVGGLETRFSLRRDGALLEKLIKKRVRFIPHFDFAKIKKEIKFAPRHPVFLLENLRFLRGEEKNDKKLAGNLASLADYYVNDAFAVSHRANASVAAITEFLPSYAGLEMEQEIKFLSAAIKNHKRPLAVVLGGAKAGDKLGVLKYFRNKADVFLLGGAPANTVMLLRGVDVKKSVVEKNRKNLREMRGLLKYKNLAAPTDFVVHNGAILDIGARTAEDFSRILKGARTIVWNGPMGLIEKKPYDRGTLAVAEAIAGNRRAFSLVGGGETVMFLKKHGLDRKFSFISTGGGAMLEFLAGKKLPGIEALKK